MRVLEHPVVRVPVPRAPTTEDSRADLEPILAAGRSARCELAGGVVNAVSPFRTFGRGPERAPAPPGRTGRDVPDLDGDLDRDLDDELDRGLELDHGPGGDGGPGAVTRRSGPDRYRAGRPHVGGRGDPDAVDGAVGWAAGPWTPGSGGVPRSARTRHARPGPGGRAPGRAPWTDDPPTDPHGFPPIPAGDPPGAEPPEREVAGREMSGWGVSGRTAGRRAPAAPPPDAQEAAALAGAFAADYLSWDEDDPTRRGRALGEYLAGPDADGPTGDSGRLGWDGRGRQRADFALPGLVRPDGDDRVLVDVRVRVTPYRPVGDPGERAAEGAAEHPAEPGVPGVPAAAPAPTGRGWRGGAAYWVRLSVPVVRDGDRLVVDAADETADGTADEAAGRTVGETAGGAGDPGPPAAPDRDPGDDGARPPVHVLPGPPVTAFPRQGRDRTPSDAAGSTAAAGSAAPFPESAW